MPRAEWGPDQTYPRLGSQVQPIERVEAIHHHTTYTPNLWGTIDQVAAEMRKVQVVRAADLGADVPYNYVAFLMTDDRVILAEGRGAHRQGAHTKYHNRTAIAISLHGNFENFTEVGPYIKQLSWCWGDLKHDEGLSNLGNAQPPGRAIFAHRDFAATDCPGKHVMAKLPGISVQKYEAQPEEEDDMTRYAVNVAIGYFEYLSNGVTKHHLIQPDDPDRPDQCRVVARVGQQGHGLRRP